MKHMKKTPSETTVDHRYQRELDARRVDAMVRSFDPDLMGVPVISRRSDGSLVRIDGQHRLAAAIGAGRGDIPVLMEVHDDLSLQKEAELFLRLNGGRTAVRALDKFKARLEAKEPVALEIRTIIKAQNCTIATGSSRGVINAIQAVESAYHRGNLGPTIKALYAWLDGDANAFDGAFIRAVSGFLSKFPEAEPMHLASRLDSYAPDRLMAKLKRAKQELGNPDDVARYVLAEIYNFRTAKTRRVGRGQDMAAAAE
jgi:hypothetical protein